MSDFSALQIFVSTTAFNSNLDRAFDAASAHDIALEFGSGLPPSPELIERYRATDIPRLPHNYFPAPEDPFVLNLASADPVTRFRSISHCAQGVQLAAEAGAPLYAAHAGFCIDPAPEDLGNQLDLSVSYDISSRYRTFCSSVRRIAGVAEDRETDFLIENNVVSSDNVEADGSTPLLCTHPADIVPFFRDDVYHPRVGLLLDTGHLKVTANTLGFDLDDAVDQLRPYIGCIHHSDNDGQSDTNAPLAEDYWFLDHLREFRNVPHVIEVRDQSLDAILRQINLLEQVFPTTS